MSKTEKLNEEQVFKQEISDDELEAVAGGGERICGAAASSSQPRDWDTDRDHCVNHHYRDIYAGGFPNCAASVEDGSWCDTNDACKFQAVDYRGMDDCGKAWE